MFFLALCWPLIQKRRVIKYHDIPHDPLASKCVTLRSSLHWCPLLVFHCMVFNCIVTNSYDRCMELCNTWKLLKAFIVLNLCFCWTALHSLKPHVHSFVKYTNTSVCYQIKQYLRSCIFIYLSRKVFFFKPENIVCRHFWVCTVKKGKV